MKSQSTPALPLPFALVCVCVCAYVEYGQTSHGLQGMTITRTTNPNSQRGVRCAWRLPTLRLCLAVCYE
jgi:hypothetical protein